MDKRKEITIYGCGMSGLVAAINLAREGHAVVVRDKESGSGGDHHHLLQRVALLPGVCHVGVTVRVPRV